MAAAIRGAVALETQLVDPNWRAPLPGGEPRLNLLTALDYFRDTSFGVDGFYDPGCDNELLAQAPDGQAELAALNAREMALFQPGQWSYERYRELRTERNAARRRRLAGMRGTQYDVLDALSVEEPGHTLYVVQASLRQGPRTTLPTALYLIIDSNVLRVPDWSALVESRVSKAAYHLQQALRVAMEMEEVRLGLQPAGAAREDGDREELPDASREEGIFSENS